MPDEVSMDRTLRKKDSVFLVYASKNPIMYIAKHIQKDHEMWKERSKTKGRTQVEIDKWAGKTWADFR